MAMSQAELLSFYRKELRRSKNWRTNRESNYDSAWRRYVDLYQGKHYDVKNDTDQLTVNLIFSTINVMAPAVAINNPRFTVNARTPVNADQAILVEEVLNYLWRTHDYQREFRLAVLDWLLIGHGWIKGGYKAIKKPEAKKVETDDSQTDTPTAEQAASEEGIDDRDPVEGNVESEMHVDDDRPFLERISPFDMYVDPDARHPKEMRWIAQRVWRPVQDVHVDERYSATQRKKVASSSWSKWDEPDGDARDSGERPDRGSIGYAEIIEFYDLKRGTVSTFAAEGADHTDSDDDSGFLIKPKDMPYADGHPFVMLRNYEVPDHFYPMGDVQQIESLQLELNETRNQMLNYRKKFRRAWVYRRDSFDRDGIAAIQSEEDNVAIPVSDESPLSDVIAPVPTVITPPEFFDQSAMIRDDMDSVSGVSDYQRGAQTAIKRTATEAAMIQDAANARAQDRLAKVESILAELGQRVVALMQQFMSEPQVARIVTIPVRGWVEYQPEWIQGRFDFEVQGGSTEPQNETFRRQSALQIVDASIPFIQAGVVNMPALYAELLRKGFGIKDAERFVELPPPPPELGGAGGPPPGPEGPMPPPGPEGPMPPMPPMGPEGSPAAGMELTPEMLAMLKMQEAQGGIPPQ